MQASDMGPPVPVHLREVCIATAEHGECDRGEREKVAAAGAVAAGALV